MKRILIYSTVLALCSACMTEMLDASSADKDSVISSDKVSKNIAPQKSKKDAASKKKNFTFKFTDENLIDVINAVAEKKGVNVALPAGPNVITSKVTIAIDEKMTADQAWKFLIQVLDIAGYSVVPTSGIYQIVKTTEAVTREALPIYIGVPWDQLPNTEQRIRCVFYLSNIKVPGVDVPETENDLYKVITTLMPSGQAGAQGAASPRLAFDPITNALIIAERSSIIRSIMQIVSAIDTTGFKEKFEMLPLFNTVASEVKDIFDKIYEQPKTISYRLDARKPTTEATYFSKFVRIIPYGRLNMLIILGREQAVDRVKEFIKKYIDVAQDTGQSVFHVYALQYLDAAEFSQILQNIVNSSSSGGTGQSRAEGTAATQGGTERMFEGVIITHDKSTDQGTGAAGTDEKAKAIYYGGNRLIVAARHDDWLRIKKLCEELDTPQPQVIIEVLVADLTLNDQRNIGSMLRNPITVPLVGDVQFQSAQLARGILVNNLDNNKNDPEDNLRYPSTVGVDKINHNDDTDILKDAYGPNDETGALGPKLYSEDNAAGNQSIVVAAPAGTMAVSLIDPCTKKVWSLLEIRNQLDYRKILTNPHIVAVNNQPTKLIIGEERLVQDAATGNQGGNATVPRKKIPAKLELNIKPRISLSPDGDPANDTVQLGIVVDINDFKEVVFNSANSNSADRYVRHVETSAHIRNREVIPLGGLLKRESSQSLSGTPILDKIPFIGSFFRNRSGKTVDSNLTVFLCPTVVRPRLRRGGVDRYTRDYVKLTKKYAQEGMLFDSLKDPVTRWFFNTGSDVVDTVNDFLADDEFKKEKEVRILSKRSQALADARKARAAKELEYKEMKSKDEDVSAMNQEEKIVLPSGIINSEPLASKVIQEAYAKENIRLASQGNSKATDNEIRLKALICNEENPLISEIPACA